MNRTLQITACILSSALMAILSALLLRLGYYYQLISITTIFISSFIIFLYTSKSHKRIFYLLISLTLLLFAASVYCIAHWEDWGAPPLGSFSDKKLKGAGKILILVPHQDDELNIVAGLLENVEDKSKVYIGFSTNADTTRGTKNVTRLKEALQVASFYGIPEKNIIFLGYGNEWDPNRSGKWGETYKHLYNVEDPNEIWPSLSGHTATWGAEGLVPFSPNTPYCATPLFLTRK